jgi:signal transduction histidine kinase
MKIILSAIFAFLSLGLYASDEYEYKETKQLVNFVEKAALLIESKGESAFNEFRKSGSSWNQKENYVFVIDPTGKMLVHPDSKLEGKDEKNLKDINGRFIIRGLIEAASAHPDKQQGWYHYQWPIPGEILPRWKSSFVKSVKAPSGQQYIVGSGIYNDRMEKSFIMDAVTDAAKLIEKDGAKAFSQFYDKSGRFMAKDTYIFVVDPKGVDLVNPGFPNLEGRNILDIKDTQNKSMIREMIQIAQKKGSGWVNYMWPKPGDNVSTQKSTYVMKVKHGDAWYVVGSGAYLSDAPKASSVLSKISAPQLETLVKEGAKILEEKGEKAFKEFKKKDSKWFKGDTYFFVWDMEGVRKFHAVDPKLEGRNGSVARDILGRPYGKMILDVASTASGEGWVHYMYPEPNQLFPIWKSAFIKRVTLPSGKMELIGSGSYNMQVDKTMIEDVVDKAAELIKNKGPKAFDELRDPKGPFFFMNTYVFVDTPKGVELVNPAYPSLEGSNIANLKDAKGKTLARDYINAALKYGSHWVEYYWYRPGSNTPTLKKAFVKKVEYGDNVYIVGSGLYEDQQPTVAQDQD